MVCQNIRLLFHLAVRPVWMPCAERNVLILDRKPCQHTRDCAGITGILLFGSRERLCSRYCQSCLLFDAWRVRHRAPLSVLRPPVRQWPSSPQGGHPRSPLPMTGSIKIIAVIVTSTRAFFLRPICFCSAFDCLLKPLASKSTVRRKKNYL
jgi:hypothetical protein